jgi:hypothetical protein
METISQRNSKINILEQSGYSSYFRRDAHYILANGYQDVRNKINSETGEFKITVQIYEAIEKRFDSFGFPEKIMNRRYAIKAEDPKIYKNEVKRLDIVVQTTEPSQKRIKYVFEAKRLKKNGFPIGLYCGDDGIMRFVQEIYASDCPEVAMIGFYQDMDVEYWFGELTRKFKENEKGNKMQVVENLTESKVISEFPNEWFSLHQRNSGSQVILFHILLDCL